MSHRHISRGRRHIHLTRRAVTFLIAVSLITLPGYTSGWRALPRFTAEARTLSPDRQPCLESKATTGLSISEPSESDSLLARAHEVDNKLPLYFIENRGQIDARVAYYVEGRDTSLYFTSRGVTFDLRSEKNRLPSSESSSSSDRLKASDPVSTGSHYALKLDFIGAQREAKPVGHNMASAVISYLKGSRDRWQTGLKTYKTIIYNDLWPGIDLVYSGTSNQLKYSFVVKPGADPNQIKLAYRGATKVKVNEAGQLEVSTPVRGFSDDKPFTYQERDGRRVEVTSAYALESDARSFGFSVGEYDRSQSLVIDPAVLFYSGFIGGTSGAEGRAIAVDTKGNAYVTGAATAPDFPVTPGAYETPAGGNFYDVFVTKISPDGQELIYSSRFGGSKGDAGAGIALRGTRAYVTGQTTSNNFPVTRGAFDTTLGGNSDAFVTVLNETGTGLLYSTYFGGSSQGAFEAGKAIAVGTGYAYVTGFTTATDFPVKSPIPTGPFQQDQPGEDAFVAKLDPSQSGLASLVYSTYLGGSGTDDGNGIAVDAHGDAWVAGNTGSSNFPVKSPIYGNQTGQDAFVTKMNPTGTALLYSTYLGGSDFDMGFAIALDSLGHAYITGVTLSTNFPTSADAFDQTLDGGFSHAFVTKLHALSGALVYSTYLGGTDGYQHGRAIAVDKSFKAHVTGFTAATNFPLKDETMPDQPDEDAFVTKLNAKGTALVYSTYLGGENIDNGYGIAVGNCGKGYVTGYTSSFLFPTTIGVWDNTLSSGLDAFAARLDAPGADLAIFKTDSPDPVQVGATLNYQITVLNNGPETATGISVLDALPQDVDLISVELPPGGSYVDWGDHPSPDIGHLIVCQVGPLPCGKKVIIKIHVTPTKPKKRIINYAFVTADETDPDTSDNTASAVTQIP
jgi:uncharacterized repeat protein (TIGR01451 family)